MRVLRKERGECWEGPGRERGWKGERSKGRSLRLEQIVRAGRVGCGGRDREDRARGAGRWAWEADGRARGEAERESGAGATHGERVKAREKVAGRKEGEERERVQPLAVRFALSHASCSRPALVHVWQLAERDTASPLDPAASAIPTAPVSEELHQISLEPVLDRAISYFQDTTGNPLRRQDSIFSQ